MATWKSAAYDGRYLQLDISESVNVVDNSSTLSWTLTSAGGASTYYTIDTTTVTINGTTVYSKDRTYWDDRVFPAKKGSVSGTITVAHDSNGSKTITVGFSTRVYIYGSQEYGGSMTLTTIDRSAPTVTFSTSNITANGFKISATSSATADIWQYSRSCTGGGGHCPPNLYSIHGGADAGSYCKGADSGWNSDSIGKTTLADQYSGKHPPK